MLSWIVVLGMPHSHESYDVKPKSFFDSMLQGLVPALNLRILIGLDLGILFVNIERFPNRQGSM
jgi:hypothetical protein